MTGPRPSRQSMPQLLLGSNDWQTVLWTENILAAFTPQKADNQNKFIGYKRKLWNRKAREKLLVSPFYILLKNVFKSLLHLLYV